MVRGLPRLRLPGDGDHPSGGRGQALTLPDPGIALELTRDDLARADQAGHAARPSGPVVARPETSHVEGASPCARRLHGRRESYQGRSTFVALATRHSVRCTWGRVLV